MNAEKQKTILLVEDEAIIALAEKMTLDKFGYNIIIAGSGEEAVATVAQTPGIDLILMDIDLGSGIDGTEAAEIILQDRNIPIVFLSSHTEPEIVARTEKITAYGFIVKNSSDTVFQALIKIVFKLFESISKEKGRTNQGDDTLEALKASEARAQALLNTIPDMLFRIDRRGVLLDYKADSKDLYAQSEPTLIGKRLRDIVPAGFADLIDLKTRATLETGTLQTFEYQLPIPGRGVHDYEARMVASSADEVTAIIRDITERNQAEAALQKSEMQRKAMLENSPVVVLLIQEGKLIYINPAAEKLIGWQEEEFIGKNFANFVHKDDMEIAVRNNRKRMGGNSLLAPYVLRIIKKSGGFVYAEINGTVIDLDGKPTMLGFLTDITERKLAEEALRKINSRLELAMNAADMAWWAMDMASGHVLFEKRKAEMLGFPPEQFKHYQDFVILIHPDDREKAMNAMRGHLDGSLPRYEVDYRIAASSGEYIWFHDIGSIGDRDVHGKPLNVTGLVINISGRKKAEAEIQRQLTEKEMLLKEVHHRIKNNFAAIGGLLSLHMQSITSPEAVAALQDAIGRVDSMRLLYEKLLLGGDFQDASTKNYIESLATSVVSLFPDLAKVKLNLDVDDFKLDPKRLFPLGIIINELLTNIMKHAFAGKKSGTIKLSLAKDGARVTLTLQDNGVGLPEGFDIDQSKGFGLMLVKMLSQQLGGSFSIEKHKGMLCRLEFNV